MVHFQDGWRSIRAVGVIEWFSRRVRLLNCRPWTLPFFIRQTLDVWLTTCISSSERIISKVIACYTICSWIDVTQKWLWCAAGERFSFTAWIKWIWNLIKHVWALHHVADSEFSNISSKAFQCIVICETKPWALLLDIRHFNQRYEGQCNKGSP